MSDFCHKIFITVLFSLRVIGDNSSNTNVLQRELEHTKKYLSFVGRDLNEFTDRHERRFNDFHSRSYSLHDDYYI